MAAWGRTPFDLRYVRWFRTEQEALDAYRPKPPVPPEPEPVACIADFSAGIQVELRTDGGHRWLMWELRDGGRIRRKDFASPFLDHAKRTAAHWLGEPTSDWRALEDTAAVSRKERRKS
jgi:hypothetical protein